MSVPTLDFSDAAFRSAQAQGDYRPAYLKGHFGDPWLAGFPAGPSPAPYSFKVFVDSAGQLWKSDRRSSSWKGDWRESPIRKIEYQRVIPDRFIQVLS